MTVSVWNGGAQFGGHACQEHHQTIDTNGTQISAGMYTVVAVYVKPDAQLPPLVPLIHLEQKLRFDLVSTFLIPNQYIKCTPC